MNARVPVVQRAAAQVLHPIRPEAVPKRAIVGSGTRISVALLLQAIGVVALLVANGSARDVKHDFATLFALGFAFLFSLAVIAMTTLAPRMQISLQAMMLYFAIFLALPGFNHASRNLYPFYGAHYDRYTQQNAALMLLIFLLGTVAAYAMASASSRTSVEAKAGTGRVDPNVWLVIALFVAAAIGTVVYLQAVGGFSGAFTRRGEARDVHVDAQLAGLGIGLPRMICVVSLIYSLVIVRFSERKSLGLLFVGLNLVLDAITLYPLALSRTALFGVLLFSGTIFVNFARPQRRLMLSLMYLVGALVAMPIANQLTRGGKTFSELDFGNLFNAFFISGDFDGLQSLNNVLIYVDHEGMQHGHQLISALLFFVPRGIWAGKALPTGAIAADAAGYKFLNISMPLPGEFYSDLGWIGVILGSFFVGWLLYRIDRFIDANWITGARGRLIAGATIGYSTIIFRGTLLGVLGPIALLVGLLYLIMRIGLRPATARPIGAGKAAIAARRGG